MEFQNINIDCKKRLAKDIRDIMKNPLDSHGIYYRHDESNILTGYAMIVGPEDTPYFGGYYFFKFEFSNQYPYSPPKVTFCTNNNKIRLHPNFYKCGKVCISLLNTWSGDQWTSCQTISSVLLTLASLITKDSLLHEPGITDEKQIKDYNKIIEYENINISICEVLSGKILSYKNWFLLFSKPIIEHFEKNRENINAFIDSKINSKDNCKKISSKTYFLTVELDYQILKEKINNLDIENSIYKKNEINI